jgi:RimJ/RimL family protein N-acetyltransferase
MTMPASQRLDFPILTVAALEALMAGDRAGLEAEMGARFPEPLSPPPLMADALPLFRDTLRADPGAGPWWARLIVVRATGEAAGSIGFSGGPDAEGTVTLGYSVYPSYQRLGIASEAAASMVAWALTQPGVRAVQATIPPGHVASEKVAAAAGMEPTGRTIDDPDEGPVAVWERTGA